MEAIRAHASERLHQPGPQMYAHGRSQGESPERWVALSCHPMVGEVTHSRGHRHARGSSLQGDRTVTAVGGVGLRAQSEQLPWVISTRPASWAVSTHWNCVGSQMQTAAPPAAPLVSAGNHCTLTITGHWKGPGASKRGSQATSRKMAKITKALGAEGWHAFLPAQTDIKKRARIFQGELQDGWGGGEFHQVERRHQMPWGARAHMRKWQSTGNIKNPALTLRWPSDSAACSFCVPRHIIGFTDKVRERLFCP